MIKKKTRRTGKTAAKKGKKTGKKKAAKRRGTPRARKEVNPAEVRKEVSKMVESEAAEIAEAVIDEAKKGQLAPAKYLFEMASIYPPAADGEQATTEEDCLAKMLLGRISPPKKAAGEEGEEAENETPRQAKADEGAGEDSATAMSSTKVDGHLAQGDSVKRAGESK
jgi:hypothetical protein